MVDQRTAAPPPGDRGSDLSVREVARAFRANRWLVMGVTLAVVGATALFTHFQAPVYESSASIQLDEESGGMNLLRDLGPLTGSTKDGIETDMVVLQSRRLAEEVVDSLALHVHLLEPRVPRADVLAAVDASRTQLKGTVELRRRRDGAYDASVLRGDGQPVMPEVVRPGEPFQLGGVTLTLHSGTTAERVRIGVEPYREAVRRLREDIAVMRPNRQARVVQVRYRSTDPGLAAEVPNATAITFLEYKSGVGKAETRSTVEFLREQVGGYQTQLRTAESTLQAYREDAKIVSPREQAEEQVRRMAALQAERDALQSEQQSLQRLLTRVQGTTAVDRPGDVESPYRQLAAYPVFLANPAVQDILKSITQLETRRSELLVLRTPENADVRSINERIAELERQLFQTAQNYLRSISNSVDAVSGHLARFGAEMEAVPAREVQFARLLREQQLLEEIYTLLQKRLKESEIEEAVQFGQARVLDAALVPDRPVAPRPIMNLVLALAVGLMLGTGSAFVRGALDNKVRTREDAVDLTGGMPVLATIPRIRPETRPVGAAAGEKMRRVVRVSPEELIQERLVVQRRPHSAVSEAYRTLRTNIAFTSLESAPRILMVTSARPGDGKSTSSSNLALTLAQAGARTLLVDADLRRGLLHRLFDLEQSPGLTNVMVGQVPLAGAVQRVPLEAEGSLELLSAGVFPPNPSELLGSPRMKELIEEMRGRYDMVVIDAPPVGLVTDSALLGIAVDATILVVRAGVTEKDALHDAARQLQHVRARIGGVILNDFQSTAEGYGYYHDMSHGNGKALPG
jgi:tyrosine-protein kinase Etk/Wzc